MKLSKIELGRRPLIAGVILGKSPVADAVLARKRGADVLELRLDQFKSLKLDYFIRTIREIKRKTHLPLIATLRHWNEEKFLPQRYRLSEDMRYKMLTGILPLVEAIDIELRAKTIVKPLIDEAHSLNKKVIVSYHNFKKTPSFKELASLAREAKGTGADIVKITTLARREEEVARLMVFTYLSSVRPLVTISMGPIGSISRLIAPIFGSCLVYAAVTKKAAPGQISL
jgi:3-dehydroquinate dehydratase-1